MLISVWASEIFGITLTPWYNFNRLESKTNVKVELSIYNLGNWKTLFDKLEFGENYLYEFSESQKNELLVYTQLDGNKH